MKIVRAAAVAVAMTILVLVPAAGGSGFHPPMASFTSRYEPGLLLDQFAAGRLGLIEPSWETTYLYVAYRYLAGPGFDADEQKVLLSFWNAKPDFQPHLGPESDWLVARSKIPGAADIRTLDVFARGPGYTFFRNCDDDAFLTATTTLQSMVAKFGASGPQVRQWLDAQDLVFQNCRGSKQNPHIPQPPPGGIGGSSHKNQLTSKFTALSVPLGTLPPVSPVSPGVCCSRRTGMNESETNFQSV